MAVERKNHPGGHYRSIRRFKEYRESARRADKEIVMFNPGEPSEAFFPGPSESESEVVIYQATGGKKSRASAREERETVATPHDIEERRKVQLIRCLREFYKAKHPANMPAPYRRYLVKYWEEIIDLGMNNLLPSS